MKKKSEFNVLVFDKKNKVLSTTEWTNKPVIELSLPKKKAKKVRYFKVINIKTAEVVIHQKANLTEMPLDKVSKNQICNVTIDLSHLFANVKKLFKLK